MCEGLVPRLTFGVLVVEIQQVCVAPRGEGLVKLGQFLGLSAENFQLPITLQKTHAVQYRVGFQLHCIPFIEYCNSLTETVFIILLTTASFAPLGCCYAYKLNRVKPGSFTVVALSKLNKKFT